MIKKITFFTLIVVLQCFPIFVHAQVINDDCFSATPIENVINWCSPAGAFTNVNALPSGFGASTCSANAGNDIWFKFIARATDITITLQPGTLSKPEMALYSGDCQSTINELRCVTGFSTGVLELYKGGLIPGELYYLRVQGENNGVGTFGLCFNNYFPPITPGSDCITSSILCDKSSFIVQSVTGAGSVPKEFDDAPCLAQGNNQASESNSTWFKWTCDQAGSLTFILTPLAPLDDLDFALYELQGDLTTCNRKLLRCEAASCNGPTGLRPQASDISEEPNCDKGQDNWLAPIQMESGKSYLLGINNYTAAGNGFKIEFGGSGTFLGPQPDFDIIADTTICREEQIQVTDKTIDKSGSTLTYSWTFGSDANPQSSTVPGDKNVSYLKRGDKIISLTVKNEKGCIVSTSKPLMVKCCGPNHEITLTATKELIDLGDSVEVSAAAILEGSNIFYQWTPAKNMSCQRCSDASARLLFRDTWIKVRAIDEFNCEAVDSILVRVDVNYPVYVPNVFSPNHDGTNDYFTIYSTAVVDQILDFKVFDRWGACVYENKGFQPNNENAGWNGFFKGKLADPAVFAWLAKIRFIDGVEKVYKGSITVIR